MRGGVKWGGLDGLRALAVLAVVGAHFRFLNLGAAIGVDLFFVLSGFLITSLLLREHQRTATVSLRRFWIRRGLRLLPALACGVLVALVVARWATPEQRHETWTGLPFVLFYFGNWARVAGGPFALGLLVHTWSLAIEEQFYFLWPLVMACWLGTRALSYRRAATIMAVVAVGAALYNLYAFQHWGEAVAYFRTDTRSMGLLAGCALALAVRGRPESIVLSARAKHVLRAGALVAFGMFWFICIFCSAQTGTAASLMYSGATLSSVVLVAFAVLVSESYWVRLLSGRGPAWVGARSYGIYLYHYPLALVFVQAHVFHGGEHNVAVIVCILVTLLLAAVSHRWVETPFLRLKERVAGEHTPTTQTLATLT